MPLVQVRIDDRLIHGQVVVGWRNVLRPQRIMLCSDEVARSDWQRTIYLSAVPSDIAASVLSTAETIEALKSSEFDRERIILLVDNPRSIVDLVRGQVPIDAVNVGGMHFKPGKNQIAPFIFVDGEDIEQFNVLHGMGVKLEGRDVPTRTPIDIVKVLNLGSGSESGPAEP